MIRTIKLMMLLFIPILMISCSSKEAEGEKTTTEESTQDVTIEGMVRMVKDKKEDSYITNVQTNQGDTYIVFISKKNLVNPNDFTIFKIGDRVMLKGVFSIVEKENHLEVKEIVKSKGTPPELVISDNSFYWVTIGNEISIYSQYLKKEVLKTAEGDLEIYRILDANKEIVGFCYADPKNKNLVGDIVIETPMAQTRNKIKVGNTFAYLAKKIPFLEVNGSEIDGKTYANFKNHSYRLDVVNHKYDVDMNKIPLDTKITEIVIHKMKEQ